MDAFCWWSAPVVTGDDRDCQLYCTWTLYATNRDNKITHTLINKSV